MADAPPRVLSLLSAATEIVHRLGCSHLLVGRSHGCDDPPLAKTLPIATAPRVDPNAPSAVLDAAVRAQSVSGGPIYQIRNELIRSLKPDVILTQEQCRICAVTPDDVAEACAGQPAAEMVTIMPVTLDDVMNDVITIATALGVPERGERLVALLRARLETIDNVVTGYSQRILDDGRTESTFHTRGSPTLAHLEWLAPLMGSGYWIAECVAAAGCTMVHGTKGGHSQTLATSELSNAEIIVIAPCGFSIERTASEVAGLNLLQSAEWQGLDAVKRGRVYVADGNLYFNRSSCGVVETAEMVAEMARPDLKGLWGHHGKHWVALDELEAFCGREGAPPPTKPVVVAEEAPRTERREPAAVPAATLKFALPAKHVEHQVELLRAGKFDEAFAMNSTANQARIGSAAKFATVVRSNAAFAALADAANACEVAEVAALNGKRQVEVRVLDLTFAFELSAAGSECATEGVRVVC